MTYTLLPFLVNIGDLPLWWLLSNATSKGLASYTEEEREKGLLAYIRI